MKSIIIAALFGFVVFLVIRSSRKRSASERACKEAFESIFSDAPVKPEYKQMYAYGYPAFAVTFPTKPDLDDSILAGTTNRFSEKIGEICRSKSNAKYPFDPGQAICYTYEGEFITSQPHGE
ncbi:MAG: hypothetical protein WBN32_03810 [Woeseia sp.]